jgi:hypothetical protein
MANKITTMGKFIALTCIVVLAIAFSLLERKRMQFYWSRACTGAAWRRRFPKVSKSEIREFLDVFVGAFGFRQSRRLCFTPDDHVMDVYRKLYPLRGTPDSMELEDLVTSLQKRYGVEIFSSWREDITLGDLFIQARSRVV